MDPFNATMMALIAIERERERELEQPHLAEALDAQPKGGVRHAIAKSIIRLGLRLHPAAGEGLPAPHAEARS